MNNYRRNLEEDYYKKLSPQKFYADLRDHIKNLSTAFDLDTYSLTDFLLNEIMTYYKEMYTVISKMDVALLDAGYKNMKIEKAMECGKHEVCLLKERLVMLTHDMMFPRINLFFTDIAAKYEIFISAVEFSERVSKDYFADEDHIITFVMENNYMQLMEGYTGKGGLYFDTVKIIKQIAEAIANSPENILLNFSQN